MQGLARFLSVWTNALSIVSSCGTRSGERWNGATIGGKGVGVCLKIRERLLCLLRFRLELGVRRLAAIGQQEGVGTSVGWVRPWRIQHLLRFDLSPLSPHHLTGPRAYFVAERRPKPYKLAH
jgi:hypothetical protein